MASFTRKEMTLNDNDPTCVARILNNFRNTGAPNRLEISDGAPSVATRLDFESASDTESRRSKKPKWSAEDDAYVSGVNLETSITDSSWEAHRTKKELIEAQALIASLENRVSQLHALRREMDIVFEAEKNTLIQQQERDKQQVRELESRVSKLRQREADTRKTCADKLQNLEREKYLLEKHQQTLQKENAELADALSEAKRTARQEQIVAADKIAELERMQYDLKAELAIEQDQKRRTQPLVGFASDKANVEKLTFELKEAQRKIQEMESKIEETREASEMLCTQQKKLLRLPEMERELERLRDDNLKLRDAIHNKMLLEEEVENLRRKCSSSLEQEKRLVQLEAQHHLLENQITEWRNLVRDFCTNVSEEEICASALRYRIQELQHTELLLTSEVSELNSVLKTSTQKLHQAEAQVAQLTQALSSVKATQDQQASFIRRCQKKLALVTGERNSYREQLDSYEKELTVSVAHHQQQNAQSRLEGLEKSLQGYRDLVENLEAELNATNGQGGSGGLSEKLRHMTAERDMLIQEKEHLEKKCNDLELEMECRVLKGDFNPAASRIMHLRMNPAATAEADREDEISALKVEVARLQERVRILQEGEHDDITSKVNQRMATTNSQEVEELRDQIKSAELMRQRLKEAFKKTSQEFRDCIYQLFGFKVDRLQNKGGIFRLSSMYADSPNDYLLFKLQSNGSLNLLETQFSVSLQELIDLHLHRHHSLPVFLASVTIDLFSRQTIITPNTTTHGNSGCSGGDSNDEDAVVLLD